MIMTPHKNTLSSWPVRAAACMALLAAAFSAALAQEPATGPATSEPATEQATLPTSEPAATGPATSQAATEPTSWPATRPVPTRPGAPLSMDFKDASLRTVLEYLSSAAGYMIIEVAKVDGRVTVMSRQPVTAEEAIDLLDTVLKEKGYAAVRYGARTLKIMTVEQAKKDKIPVQMGSDPEALKASDRLVTQIIPIRFADAVKLKADLAAMIPSSADVTTNAASNTLIITGTEAVIHRVVEIIKAIDRQMSEGSVVKVFQLKNANATSAARLITEIFREDQTTGGGGGRGGGLFGGGRTFVIPGMPGQEEAGKRADKVLASADDRTNTLVVSAATDVMKVIESVIKDLDADPTQPQAVYTYRLRNAKAKNIEAVLNNTFGASGVGTGGTSAQRTGQQNVRGGTGAVSGSAFGNRTGGGTSGGRTGGMGNTGGTAGGRTGGGTGTTGGRTGGGTIGGMTGGRAGGAAGGRTGGSTAADLMGQVFVVADEDTNSLLVTTSSTNWPRVQGIIAELDRAVPQVLIKVLIAEVTHDKSLDLGVEFSGLNLRGAEVVQGLAVGKEVPIDPITGVPMAVRGRGFNSGSNFGVAAQTNGFIFKLDEKNVTAAIRAIANTSKLDVLSRPYILGGDNQQAEIFVGQDVPIVTRTQVTDAGQTINTIERQQLGIDLLVTPHINPQGLVTLDAYAEISALTGQTVQISDTVSAPVFVRRYAQNRVAIRDGQTIVIGGLMEDRLTKSVDKVPFLGDIPLLGLLFQRSVDTKTKTELLIFLTPHVAQQPEDLKGMSEDEKAGTRLVPNAVEPGTFDEHLRGMQRGAATRPAEEESQPPYPEGLPASQPDMGESDDTRP